MPPPRQFVARTLAAIAFVIPCVSSAPTALAQESFSCEQWVVALKGDFASDFDAAHQELKRRGVKFVTDPYEVQGNRLVFFADGDGNFVHLIRRQKPLP